MFPVRLLLDDKGLGNHVMNEEWINALEEEIEKDLRGDQKM